MKYTVEDLEDPGKFTLILKVSYNDLLEFVFEYLKKTSPLASAFWGICLIFLGVAVYIRINIAGMFPFSHIFLHSVLGMVIMPVLCIPLHELLHIVPYVLSGARNIRVGMELKQYLFYVTAHRYVASPAQFFIVALTPLILISAGLAAGVYFLPGLWKWSLSLFLFVHATMCAGDIALLNMYYLNNGRSIYTWDDADKKEAYYYKKLYGEEDSST